MFGLNLLDRALKSCLGELLELGIGFGLAFVGSYLQSALTIAGCDKGIGHDRFQLGGAGFGLDRDKYAEPKGVRSTRLGFGSYWDGNTARGNGFGGGWAGGRSLQGLEL